MNPLDRRPTILIVDDDGEMARLLCDALDREGFSATAELRPRDALIAAERQIFDVAIVDKEMPEINGLDLMSALRARRPELRIILLTAFGGPVVARAARERGADRYLEKPIRLDVLVENVRAVIRNAGAAS